MAVVNNQHFVYKIGESVSLASTLSDADGVFDFTGWTVTLNVRDKAGGTKIIDNLACTANASGVVSCTINSAAFVVDATVSERNYVGEWKAVLGSATEFWPKDANNNRTYFTFEVQRSLA